MKFTPAISAAFLLFAFVQQVHGQEELSDADKALFDDLQVTEEAEKSARQQIEKSATPSQPQPELPATAAKLLDRLAVFEASLYGVTDEAIALSRKTLGAQLIKLSDTTADPAKLNSSQSPRTSRVWRQAPNFLKRDLTATFRVNGSTTPATSAGSIGTAISKSVGPRGNGGG